MGWLYLEVQQLLLLLIRKIIAIDLSNYHGLQGNSTTNSEDYLLDSILQMVQVQ